MKAKSISWSPRLPNVPWSWQVDKSDSDSRACRRSCWNLVWGSQLHRRWTAPESGCTHQCTHSILRTLRSCYYCKETLAILLPHLILVSRYASQVSIWPRLGFWTVFFSRCRPQSRALQNVRNDEVVNRWCLCCMLSTSFKFPENLGRIWKDLWSYESTTPANAALQQTRK